MHRSVTNVLFVSRENAARSLLAEACLIHLGGNKFKAYSCGVPLLSHGQPKDWTLLALQTAGISATSLQCKTWTEFTRSGAPKMDFVIALDASTAHQHPSWPGQPETALWAFEPFVLRKNNGAAVGLETLQTLHSLRRRIELLLSLHSKGKTRSDLRDDLRDLGYL